VARLLTDLSRREPGAAILEGDVNFAACLFITAKDGPLVVTGSARDSMIASLTVMANPEKVKGAQRPRVMR
jgi:hypothetical protein